MARKRKLKILFLLDPLDKLNCRTDTSLQLARVYLSRGHRVWTADISDLACARSSVTAQSRELKEAKFPDFRLTRKEALKCTAFDLIIIRNEPPFSMEYLSMTYLMDQVSDRVVISNHPSGIRMANEKISSFYFRKWMPDTLVSASPDQILTFQKKLNKDIVIKPLYQAGGDGIFQLRRGQRNSKRMLQKATGGGCQFILAQEFINFQRVPGDKRIILLNGDFLGAYERHVKEGEFRANLHKGATYHATRLNSREKTLVRALGPTLRKWGIHFAGIDIIEGKLIEINVTCPGGVIEASLLYPELKPIEAWADYLELLVKARRL